MSSHVPTASVRRARRLLSAILRRVDGRRATTPRVHRCGPHTNHEDLATQVGALREQVNTLQGQLHHAELLFGSTGGRGDRRPTRKAVTHLETQVTSVTGVEEPHTTLVQAFRTLVEVEMRGIGRIAGGTMNVLGKLVTTPLLGPPSGEYLEIGSLYGLFSCCFSREMARHGMDCRMSIVDPLATVQVQPGRKNATDRSGAPVSEDALRANLTRAGVPGDRVRIIQGYSTDPDVRADLSDRKYGIVIVDGDHSEEGVRKDLEWVQGALEPGAIVVLDDYGDKKWPGVQRATDTFVRGSDRFTFLGTVATSAFLRAT